MSLGREPIMILGAFRSGTSSLAAVLVKLGVYFGEERALYGANEHNPGGHFELIDLQMFDNNVFDTFGMKYYSGGGLPENWRERPAADMMIGTVRQILNKHFAGRKSYGWKDPSASGLVPIYKAALAAEHLRATYPICFRHPLSVVSSMRKRAGTPAKKSAGNSPADHSLIDIRMMGVWLYYTLASLKDTNGERRQIFCYENFLEKPVEYVERIAELIGVPIGADAKDAAVASIRPEWSHTRFGMQDLAGWPEIVTRVYETCLQADNDPAKFASGAFDKQIDALWEEWRSTRKMLRDGMSPGEKLAVSWTSGDRSIALASGGWTAGSFKIDAAAGTQVRVNPYPSISQVWIRRADWRAGRVRKAALRSTSNGMLEQVYGLTLLTAFGPDPLILETPAANATLDIEVFVESDRDVLIHLVPLLRDQMGRV